MYDANNSTPMLVCLCVNLV